jgi:hypothetical protein
MTRILKKKSKTKKIYSEENAYFLSLDMTDYYDWSSAEKIKLSYEEAYQIGKEAYEREFGPLVGVELKTIRSNLNQLYHDQALEEKNNQDLEVPDIGNAITYLGRDIWLKRHYWENFKNSYRQRFGIPKEIISEKSLKIFFNEYSSKSIQNSERSSKLKLLNQIKKTIRTYVDDLIKNVYDEKRKEWYDFDVTHEFAQVRKLMIDTSDPIPAYVWNLIDGNPFHSIYRVCRDYMKWKQSLIVYKKVFESICNWESGYLLYNCKALSKYEEELWVNWNRVANDYISSKNLIMTLNGGLRWLKEEFRIYIKERKKFYDKFSTSNELVISDDIIQIVNSI